jgi:hypothetical protein
MNYYCLKESDRNIVYLDVYIGHQSDQWILNLFYIQRKWIKNVSISENKNRTRVHVIRTFFSNYDRFTKFLVYYEKK